MVVQLSKGNINRDSSERKSIAKTDDIGMISGYNKGNKAADWKLFRSKISDWQEAYMEKLCKEYIDILSADGSSADRFWAVEERIKGDRKKVGVQAEMRRSQMFYNIVSLIREGAISLEDLDGFSEELKQAAEASMNW